MRSARSSRAGGRQVVLLGAGYDTRALRLPELADATVLEVDHPATQGRKRSVLAKLGADSPARYVTWDFETRAMEDLPDVLEEAGLDRGAARVHDLGRRHDVPDRAPRSTPRCARSARGARPAASSR